MNANRKTLAVAAVVFACIAFLWLSASIEGSEKTAKTYEIEPQITIPEYKTDATRAIDAYERLMYRVVDLSEKNLLSLNSDLKTVAKKLDSLDDKLSELSARLARIEKALGIEPPKPTTDKTAPPVPADENAPAVKALSPSGE